MGMIVGYLALLSGQIPLRFFAFLTPSDKHLILPNGLVASALPPKAPKLKNRYKCNKETSTIV